MKANDAAKHEAKVNGGEASLLGTHISSIVQNPLQAPTLSSDSFSILVFRCCAEPAPVTKRKIVEPRGGFMLENVTAETITPIPYDIIKEGLKT